MLTALGRLFAEDVLRATKRLAGVAGAETGAITFVQRFGGSLNLHVHFHLLAADAVFEKVDGGVRAHEALPPTKSDLDDVHCPERVAADDAEGHERLVRSCARSPFALERIAPLALFRAEREVVLVGPTTLSAKRWQRLEDGELLEATFRLDRAVLLRRTHGIDARSCPWCDAKVRSLATLTDPPVVRAILTNLGVRTEPRSRARARDPTGQATFGKGAA